MSVCSLQHQKSLILTTQIITQYAPQAAPIWCFEEFQGCHCGNRRLTIIHLGANVQLHFTEEAKLINLLYNNNHFTNNLSSENENAIDEKL